MLAVTLGVYNHCFVPSLVFFSIYATGLKATRQNPLRGGPKKNGFFSAREAAYSRQSATLLVLVILFYF